jgi:hypothetical protein
MTRAWVPWLAFVAVLAFIVVLGIKWSKVRVIQRDAFGALPAVVINGLLRDPDREPGPDMATTERAQLGQMVRSMPAGRALQDLPQFTREARTPMNIEVVDAEVLHDWIDDVSKQADEKEA